ncbi:MAG: hypothetical protein KY475_11255 [Planctomycetes bacterium]|nr:hypothetical protein [Planctomycetota bacterium]
MPRYHVRCGSLKVTILAADAQEAALESLGWWSEGWGDDGDAHHRRYLAEQMLVTEPGTRRPTERFITFDLLASLHGESPTTAWRRVLECFDPTSN